MAILCYRDHVKDATLAATNEVASLPGSRMANPYRAEIARFSGATTQIDLTFPANVTARCLALAGIGDSGWAGFSTWTIKASTTALGNTDALDWNIVGSPTPDYGVDTTLMQAFGDFGLDVSARYWRIDLTGAGVSNLEIGRLYLGEDLSLTDGPVLPLDRPFEDRAIRRRLESGDENRYERAGLRAVTVRFGPAASEGDLVNELERKLDRATGQVLWVQDPTSSVNGVKSMVLGTITETGPARISSGVQWGKQYTITEAGSP